MHLEEEGKGKRQFGDGKYEYTMKGKGKCGWSDVIKHLGVVVQWLDYLAVMQEAGVQFPTAEKVASNVAPPSGHGINYT